MKRIVDTAMPASKSISPLDIEGVDMKITSKEIVQFIHESRKVKWDEKDSA